MKDLQPGRKFSLALQSSSLAWSKTACLLQDKAKWNVWFADVCDRFEKEADTIQDPHHGRLFNFHFWVETYTPCGPAQELHFLVETWVKDNNGGLEVWIPNVWVSREGRFAPVLSIGYRWERGRRKEFGFVDYNILTPEAVRQLML